MKIFFCKVWVKLTSTVLWKMRWELYSIKWGNFLMKIQIWFNRQKIKRIQKQIDLINTRNLELDKILNK